MSVAVGASASAPRFSSTQAPDAAPSAMPRLRAVTTTAPAAPRVVGDAVRMIVAWKTGGKSPISAPHTLMTTRACAVLSSTVVRAATVRANTIAVTGRAALGNLSDSGPATARPSAPVAPKSARTPPSAALSIPATRVTSGPTYVKTWKCPTSSSAPNVAVTATATSDRSRPPAPVSVLASAGTGVAGRRTARSAAAAAPSTTAVPTSTARQPTSSAAAVPSGTPTMPAAVGPTSTIDTALPRCRSSTSEAAYGTRSDQRSPWAAAATIRATTTTAYPGASAASNEAAALTSTAPTITSRRGRRRVSRSRGRPRVATVNAHAVTSSPTLPRETPRSSAITGSSPAGRSSIVTVAKAAPARVSSAVQVRPVIPGRVVVCAMLGT